MPYRRVVKMVDKYSPRVLAVILVLLAVGSASYIWWNTARFEEFVECQARWGGDLTEYQVSSDQAEAGERSIADFEARILNQLVEDLIDPQVDDDDAIAAWQEQHDVAERRRMALEDERESNPLPGPPLEVCDAEVVEGDRGRVITTLFD